MRNTRTVTALAALAATAALVLAGCGQAGGSSASESKEPAAGFPASYTGDLPQPDANGRYDNPQPRSNIKDGGTLTLPTVEIGPNWNVLSTDGNTQYMQQLWYYYQPNLVMATNTSGTPLVANKDYLTDMKLVSENPMVVQYDINPKATWNDGTPIDWTAFESTWKALNGSDPNYNPPSTDGFDKIDSVKQGDNAKQVIVTYKTPFYPWQGIFTNLVNPKAADAKTFTQGWANNPHNEWAAGPYKIAKYSSSEVDFVPNDKWWGDKPKLDKIVVRQMSSTAAVNAFMNGEIDAVATDKGNVLKQIRTRKDAQLRYGLGPYVYVLNYNGSAAPLDDLQVRKALTQAFDAATYNKIRFQGTNSDGTQAGSELILPFQKGFENNRPKDSNYSVANAKKTLEADGYKMGSDGYYAKDGKTLTVSYTTFGDDAVETAEANAYQAMLKKAGVKITIKNFPDNKFSTTVNSHDYQIIAMGWAFTTAYDFIAGTSQIYASDSDSNYTGVGNKQVDDLIKQVTAKSDYNDQIAAANAAEKQALALYGTVPTTNATKYTAVKQGLANYGLHGFAQVLPQDIGWQK